MDAQDEARAARRRRGSLAAGALAACLILTPAQPRAETLRDATGRSLALPARIAAVVPAGAPAQVLLHALTPEALVGLVQPFTPDHAIYVDPPTLAALPQIPALTRTDAPGDVAAVAKLKPGFVLDYGSVSPRYVAADEEIQRELAVPTALFGGGLADTGAAVEALGLALGVPARAKIIATLVADVLAGARPVSTLPDAARVTIYLARGTDGLMAVRAGTAADEPIRLAGGRNVVAGGGGMLRRMSVDEVVALKPAVVVVSEQEALAAPLHAALPASTRFVLDAGEPYKVLTGPPSINRIVGLAALAAILHPELKNDPEAVTRLETTLFPIPPGLSEPAPLQVRE